MTAYNLKGRGAELSELQAFNGKVTSKQTPKQPVFQAVVHACVRACVRVRVCVCVCVCLSVFLSVCLFVCQCLPLLCARQADTSPHPLRSITHGHVCRCFCFCCAPCGVVYCRCFQLYTADDRTGIVYEVHGLQLIPRFILSDGGGDREKVGAVVM